MNIGGQETPGTRTKQKDVRAENMTPTQVVTRWVEKFNAADIEGLMVLYAPDAINHQVVTTPLKGRDEIRKLFEVEFGRAKMVCIPVKLHEAGDWAILEWRDPLGLHGCGFFEVKNDLIVFQRGYFDQLTLFRIQGLPVPPEYLKT
jgi:limonene-1,2-epoxide hydrolase